jgi:hypothetical protein
MIEVPIVSSEKIGTVSLDCRIEMARSHGSIIHWLAIIRVVRMGGVVRLLQLANARGVYSVQPHSQSRIRPRCCRAVVLQSVVFAMTASPWCASLGIMVS